LWGCGTQTAALAVGGEGPPITGATEEYDGNSWTTVNPLNSARQLLVSIGTQPATLAFGGSPGGRTETEEWNGAGTPQTKTITAS